MSLVFYQFEHLSECSRCIRSLRWRPEIRHVFPLVGETSVLASPVYSALWQFNLSENDVGLRVEVNKTGTLKKLDLVLGEIDLGSVALHDLPHKLPLDIVVIHYYTSNFGVTGSWIWLLN